MPRCRGHGVRCRQRDEADREQANGRPLRLRPAPPHAMFGFARHARPDNNGISVLLHNW
jgi:hypothetical protein